MQYSSLEKFFAHSEVDVVCFIKISFLFLVTKYRSNDVTLHRNRLEI